MAKKSANEKKVTVNKDGMKLDVEYDGKKLGAHNPVQAVIKLLDAAEEHFPKIKAMVVESIKTE